MTSVYAALVWVAGLAFLWYRAEPLLKRVLAHWESRGAAAIVRDLPPDMPKADPMPVDLHLWISEQSEPWAREQLGQKAQELYGQYREWDTVRTLLSA